MSRVAFLGLGVMGGPIAGHLAAAGHEVVVFNRTAARAAEWVERHGGRSASTPAEAAEGTQAVFACVGADADVEAVTTGPDGCFSAMAAGTVFVDHTTIGPATARRLADEGTALDLHVLDAPVSGGQAGAEAGQLAVMCGGTGEAMASARPFLNAYGKRIVHVGPAGAGQSAKMANQIAIAGVLQGLAEAVRFVTAAGLDPTTVHQAIGGGAAQSWQMDNRWATMAEGRFDFGFAVDWMRKDLGLAIAEANALGVGLPLTALVDQFYAEVQAMGGGRDDTSSLLRRLR